jgi:hypothetical protein
MMATHISTHGAICPYCSLLHHADGPDYYEEGCFEIECHSCETAFEVNVSTTVTWETQTATTTKEDQ